MIEEPTGGLVQVVADATAGDPETRIGYSESGNRMNYTWGEFNTERFSVFVPGSNQKHDFSLKGGAHSRKGRFEGQIPEGSTTTYAVYPGLNANPVALTAITHDLSNQRLCSTPDALSGNTKHLMWTTADASQGELNYQFSHKVSMLKLELNFPEPAPRIKSVSILGAHNKANLNLTNGILSYEDAGKGPISAIDSTGIALVDNVLTAYVHLFPEDLSSDMLTIIVSTDGGFAYTSGEFSGRLLNPGTVYRLRKDMLKSNYILINNIKWANGNLIADGDNGMKIGTPRDGGLFFQFGSLVGWSGGKYGDGTGTITSTSLYVRVKPEACSISTWNSSWIGDATSDVPETGKGDPCRYYLGAPWRLPNREEFKALFGQGLYDEPYIHWGPAAASRGWILEGTFTKYASHISGLKFDLMGQRLASSGVHVNNGTYGFCWSSNDSYPSAVLMLIGREYILPSAGGDMADGYPIRCVRE